MSQFSSALRLGDLDDFITPSQACIKPELINAKNRIPNNNNNNSLTPKNVKIELTSEGKYIEIGDDDQPIELESAKISLNDCLACSGCVTSAESILITAQSTQEFLSHVGPNKASDSCVVVSIAPQCTASLATHYNMSLLSCYKKLITMFKGMGADHVFDISFSREFSLLESAAEFMIRKKNNQGTMITSACPGWICYAEKTHGEFILPFISSTKSPQQIAGTVIKEHFAAKLGKKPNEIYHVTVMPCFDKKLEASRDDFFNDVYQTRDVDCVLATIEIVEIISDQKIDFVNLNESPTDQLFTNVKNESQFFGMKGSSGGYAEYVFIKAAKELYGVDIKTVEWKTPRKSNPDFKITTLEINSETKLTFAIANGFKNIQNVVRKLKTHSSANAYDFVEIMACPGGCLNGGGQIKPAKGIKANTLLEKLETVYSEQTLAFPEDNSQVQELYKVWLNQVFPPVSLESKLHTQYHAREKINHPLAIKW